MPQPNDNRGPANDRQVGGSHYKTPISHWDFVLANDIPYLEAQIIRYLIRGRKKNGLEDLQKAQHYLDKLTEWAKETGVEVKPTTTTNTITNDPNVCRHCFGTGNVNDEW